MMVLERCMFDYSQFSFISYIRFHIVRHSNEDNIENGIALHHDDDEAKQQHKSFRFRMKAKDLAVA